jgi:S-adenosylmethionine:tRNA ribosyltransferase-isomerase
VRALEGAALAGPLRAGAGITDLRVGADHPLRLVDGILSGVHAPEESHFALLSAFAPAALLRAAWAEASARGFRPHERGDALLVLRGPSGH